MTDTTLVTAAQLATAQAQATAIANSAKIVAPANSFKFLALFDGTRNIASDPTYSADAQPTSIGQLFKTLENQGPQPNSGTTGVRLQLNFKTRKTTGVRLQLRKQLGSD